MLMYFRGKPHTKLAGDAVNVSLPNDIVKRFTATEKAGVGCAGAGRVQPVQRISRTASSCRIADRQHEEVTGDRHQ